jgi:hypothetical protein
MCHSFLRYNDIRELLEINDAMSDTDRRFCTKVVGTLELVSEAIDDWRQNTDLDQSFFIDCSSKKRLLERCGLRGLR